MDDREQQRKVRHRLAMIRHAQEVTGNVAQTCRYYGISRPCFYKWLHRYEELGEEGLRDGSSRPLNSPAATVPSTANVNAGNYGTFGTIQAFGPPYSQTQGARSLQFSGRFNF